MISSKIKIISNVKLMSFITFPFNMLSLYLLFIVIKLIISITLILMANVYFSY